MVEVPSLLFQLDELLERVDFLSVGSNDLVQFLFAADRGNPRVTARFDELSLPMLRALQDDRRPCRAHGKPVTVCGEMARGPLSALDADRARLPLLCRSSLGGRPGEGDGARARRRQGRGPGETLIAHKTDGAGSIRYTLLAFAAAEGIPLYRCDSDAQYASRSQA